MTGREVSIRFGMLRLVGRSGGTYEVQELGRRGPETVAPGDLYAKRRHSCSGLSQALARIVDLWPQHGEPDAPAIRSVEDLAAELDTIRSELQVLFDGAGPRPLQLKCERCGRFFSPHDVDSGEARVLGGGRYLCPEHAREEAA